MNKNFIIGGVVVVIVVVAGVLVFGGEKNAEQNQPQNQEEVQNQEQSEKDAQTLRDFINGKTGQNMKCEFTSQVGEASTLDVTTYVAGERVRVDYSMQPPINGQSTLHMVSDGNYSYLWGDSKLGNMFAGMKFRVEEEGSQSASQEAEQFVDYDMPMINCERWNPDEEMFETPDDIEFVDMEEMANSEAGVTGQMPGVDCSVCDQVPEAQRQTCLDSLGCE